MVCEKLQKIPWLKKKLKNSFFCNLGRKHVTRLCEVGRACSDSGLTSASLLLNSAGKQSLIRSSTAGKTQDACLTLQSVDVSPSSIESNPTYKFAGGFLTKTPPFFFFF